MRKSVILLTSLLLILGVAASASAETGAIGVDYSLESQQAFAYGSMALTDKIKVGGEYTGAGEFVVNVLYQATGDAMSSLDIGVGVSATTPINAYLVLQGTNYVSTKLFLHTAVAYRVTPAPTDLSWSAGIGYDITEAMYARVTYKDNAVSVGVGLRF